MSKVIIRTLNKIEFKEKEIQKWQIWTCEASTFPWEYADKESCYILEGYVDVELENGDKLSIGPGDFVVFPKGLKCVWHVQKAIKKHFIFN